jgi:hypothetical protein
MIIAASAAGCASNTANSNSPGTTTYGNSNTASGAGGAASNANANSPAGGGIKPPTSK